MMRKARQPLAVRLLVALLVGALPLLVHGCGGGTEGKQVAVSPELQAKTDSMLKNMAKDMQTKYKNNPEFQKKMRRARR